MMVKPGITSKVESSFFFDYFFFLTIFFINFGNFFSELFCAFQGAAVVNDNKTGVLIGSFSDRRDWSGNGIKITTDAGSSWAQINSNFGTTPVRYGIFAAF